MVHETWAYRHDGPRFTSGEMTQEKMYQDLSSTYRDIAAELGLPLIPVGTLSMTDTYRAVGGYRPVAFDSRDMHYPNLPDRDTFAARRLVLDQDKAARRDGNGTVITPTRTAVTSQAAFGTRPLVRAKRGEQLLHPG